MLLIIMHVDITPDEIDQFDNEWEKRADKALPGWKESHAQMLDTGRSGRIFILNF